MNYLLDNIFRNHTLHLFLICAASHFFPSANAAQLVIIIDDIGNNYARGAAIAEIDGPLTLAFLPHTPHAKTLALEAYKNNKEIILHAPMENSGTAPLGPGALTLKLTKDEFQTTLHQSIDSIPHIQGINNHMGSALTQNIEAMNWVMETVKQQQLYFVDSLTSPHSIAYQQALKHQLPALRRQVFLDNETTMSALTRQWKKALSIAKKNGSALIIGHPYKNTHTFLTNEIPKLKAEGIELVPASQLFLKNAWRDFDLNIQHVKNRTNRYLLNNKDPQISERKTPVLMTQNNRD